MKILVNIAFFFLKILPIPFYYFIGNCFFYITYYLLRYRRDVVHQNIIKSFPGFDENKVTLVEKEFYRHLSDYFVESGAIVRLSEKAFQKRFRYLNGFLLEKYRKEGKNILILAGHYGNWEWFCTLPLITGYPVFSLYKPQHNLFVDEAMVQSREKYGMRLLPYPGLYKEIISLPVENPVAVLMAADQRPLWNNKDPWIEFMNQPITCFRGLENIHKAMKGHAVFAKIVKIKRGHYTVEFIPLDETRADLAGLSLTERYFIELEKSIRSDPAYYLWSHKRWKFIKPSG